MRKAATISLITAAMVAGAFSLRGSLSRRGAGESAPSRLVEPAGPATALDFGEFFEPGSGLKPSAKLLSLAGKRVQLVGFMVKMEVAPKGAFYLAPRHLECDEAGGGTADLPPESVKIVVPFRAGEEVPHVEGPLVASGVLEVGNRADEEGRVSAFRLALDSPTFATARR